MTTTIRAFSQETRRMLQDAAILGRGVAFGDAVTISAAGEDKTAIQCRLTGEAGTIQFSTFGAWAEPGSLTLATSRTEEGGRSLPTIARNLPPGGKADLSQESAKRAVLSGTAGKLSYRIPLEAKGYTILPLVAIPETREAKRARVSIPVSALLSARALVKPIVGGGRAGVPGFDHLHFRAEGKEVVVGGTDGYRAIRVTVAHLQFPIGEPFGWSIQREAFDLLCRLLLRQRGKTVTFSVRGGIVPRWDRGYDLDVLHEEQRTIARVECEGIEADLIGIHRPAWEWATVFPEVPELLTISVNKGLLQQWTRVLSMSAFSEDVIAIGAGEEAGSMTLGTKHGGIVTIPASVKGRGSFYVQGKLLLSSIGQWPGKSIQIGYSGGGRSQRWRGGVPLRLSVPGDKSIRFSLMPLYRLGVEAEAEEGSEA